MSTVILLGHGSPDPRSSQGAHALAEAVANRLGRRTVAAFLQHDDRTLEHAVRALPSDEPAVIVPLLLSRAFHAKVDVPAAVAATGRPLTVTAPLGPAESLLLAAEAELDDGPYVLATAGTTDPEALAEVHALATAASLRRGASVVPGFASSASPDVAAALAQAERGGGTAAVLAFVLFPGVLPDRIRAAAPGRRVTAPLGGRAEVVDLVVRRIDEAA